LVENVRLLIFLLKYDITLNLLY